MKNALFTLVVLASTILFFSNCASLSGLQDGRTTGRNNGEVVIALNVSQSPDFNDWEDSVDSINIPNIYAPYLEFGGRFGVGERVDISLRLNTNLNIAVGAKAQVVGDRTSQTALSIGFEAGTFAFISGLWNLSLPVYFSLHPSEKFSWYLTPRYTYQFASYTGANNGASYIGGNTGLLFGNRNKFGLDFGYYRFGAGGEGIGLVQIGLGGRFAIGRN